MQKELLQPFVLYYGRICTFYILDLKMQWFDFCVLWCQQNWFMFYLEVKSVVLYSIDDQKIRIHLFRTIISYKCTIHWYTLFLSILCPILNVEWFAIITKKNDLQSRSKKCTLHLTQIIISSWFRWFRSWS